MEPKLAQRWIRPSSSMPITHYTFANVSAINLGAESCNILYYPLDHDIYAFHSLQGTISIISPPNIVKSTYAVYFRGTGLLLVKNDPLLLTAQQTILLQIPYSSMFQAEFTLSQLGKRKVTREQTCQEI